MTLQKAIENLKRRLSTDKSFTPYPKDRESLNTIIDYINNQMKGNVNNNLLFAKLYIYTYNQFLKYYKSSIFDEITQKELHKLLDTDIELFYKAFKSQLEDNSIYDLIEKDESLENAEKFELDYVKTNLNMMINMALNKFS